MLEAIKSRRDQNIYAEPLCLLDKNLWEVRRLSCDFTNVFDSKRSVINQSGNVHQTIIRDIGLLRTQWSIRGTSK